MNERKTQTFFEETAFMLWHIGREADDIKWIGSRDGKYAIKGGWNQFKELANFTPSESIVPPQDIVIVFNDGSWMGREKLVGSKAPVSWFYSETPRRLSGTFNVQTLMIPKQDMYEQIEDAELNEAIDSEGVKTYVMLMRNLAVRAGFTLNRFWRTYAAFRRNGVSKRHSALYAADKFGLIGE